jgi:hypothetical protein
MALPLSLLLVAGCIDDLDPPKACPPGEQHPAGDCLGPLMNAKPGCLGTLEAKEVACLAGKRSTCDCLPDECPAAPDACYPPGDCPPDVVEAVGPQAQCIRLNASDFGNGVPQLFQCVCGCAGCAAVCDGKGPVVGVLDDGSEHGYPIINIKKYMKKEGRLGLYVRARGLSNVAIGVATGDPKDFTTWNWTGVTYFLTTPLDSFAEVVFFDQQFLGGSPAYSWTSQADEPALVAFASGHPEDGGAPVPTLYELDCVIPFVLPK